MHIRLIDVDFSQIIVSLKAVLLYPESEWITSYHVDIMASCVL